MRLLERLRYWCAKPYLMSIVGHCALMARAEAGREYQRGFADGWNAVCQYVDGETPAAEPRAPKVVH